MATQSRTRRGYRPVARKAGQSGLTSLALSFVLPHENHPVRLPVVPAAYTALLETMADGTIPITDSTSKAGFLCRDAAYPLWIEKTVLNAGACIDIAGSVTTWTLTSTVNDDLTVPNIDQLIGLSNSGALDGRSVTAGEMADQFVFGTNDGYTNPSIYIPPGSTFFFQVETGAAGGGSGLEVDFASEILGEQVVTTLLVPPTATGFLFQGVAGTTTVSAGSVKESGGGYTTLGVVPSGFLHFKAWRTTATAPTGSSTPRLYIGWLSGGTPATPSGSVKVMLPYAMPPEFNNSTLPYSRTRLNSSAALFTNVTAALSKEGTVLAGRLKQSVVQPWSFTTSHLNSVHPKLRYFGPLEKGLYTFTTPTGNTQTFDDCWLSCASNSPFTTTTRPVFHPNDIGVYNGFIFSDLGSAGVGTQLAVSAYCHLEFEATSSLFNLGVSSLPVEALHATEVALLRFGHFHENPLHWAALRAAVMTAAKFAAPILAPYAQRAGQYLLDRGVQILSGKPAGDRTMQQATLQRAPVQRPAAKPRAQRRKQPQTRRPK